MKILHFLNSHSSFKCQPAFFTFSGSCLGGLWGEHPVLVSGISQESALPCMAFLLAHERPLAARLGDGPEG